MALEIKIEESKFADKPVVEKIYENETVRVVLFYLKSGSIIDLHTSTSTVITTVLKGSGKFYIGSRENIKILQEGETLIYDPNEPHGFEAVEDMVVQAIITLLPVKRLQL